MILAHSIGITSIFLQKVRRQRTTKLTTVSEVMEKPLLTVVAVSGAL